MMKRMMISLVLSAAMILVMAPGAFAHSQTAEGAEARGWFCFNTGPDNWTHCLQGQKVGTPNFLVKIFSEDGNDFLGDEYLIRKDKYSGGPCIPDNLEIWDGPLGPDIDGDDVGDYFACHQFDTGRN